MPACYGLHSLLRELEPLLDRPGSIQISGAGESFAQLVLGALALRDYQSLVVVLPRAKDVSPWSQYLENALPSLRVAKESLQAAALPYVAGYGTDRYVNPSSARRQRLYALAQLADSQPTIIVTTLAALAQTTLGPRELREAALELAREAEYDLDDLEERLEDLGYLSVHSVEEEGTFAVRGGIVDLFPPNLESPVRLEFVGDRLASLRLFSVSDQRSRQEVSRVLVYPAGEVLTPSSKRSKQVQALYTELLSQTVPPGDRDGMVNAFRDGIRFSGFDMFLPLFREGRSSTFEHLGDGRSLLIFPKTIEACLEAFRELHGELTDLKERDAAQGRPTLPVTQHFLTPDEVSTFLDGRPLLEFGNPMAPDAHRFLRLEGRTVVQGAPPPVQAGHDAFDKWFEVIKRTMATEGGTVAILAHHDEQLERIKSLLGYRGMSPEVDGRLFVRLLTGDLPPGRIYLGHGDLSGHAWLDENQTLVLPEPALFGPAQRKSRPASRKLASFLSSFKDLKVGDLVVHVEHGIARYQGMTEIEIGGQTGDFLILEYAGGDRIYLPVDRLSLLQRYSSGSESQAGVVDRLGSNAFERRKAKVRGAVRDMAEQLLRIQAQRALAQHYRYGPPDETYLKFEAAFPYEETEDQLKALADVEADLRSDKPMDRLICGDVGFGKTEVALRAAMRCVLEGMQVLVLVPTTVLCYQHYRTFSQRLSPFGVKVAQVNRFVTGRDLKEALQAVQTGHVDILIGTHRLLSKDVKPKKLGLLIVDEEQRFGVAHKEKLKELRSGADVLTLTATPIPRTLHMSMVGLRDISIIATPPQDRLSVKTYVARFDETLIREAIEHEIARGGQVFFVHNRVEDIEEMALFVRSLVPGREVRTAHGQMREHLLERQIVDFLEQKFPVLVCTTIIESGVDMPNVNTLIVNRADRFGLAQLYQLRGRVGRSNLQAYAYFLTPPTERLSDEARERLDVLAAHQELGAGFQIASHDLEIRGAGNLLGAEQSGHAAAVGLELYTELLEQAIAELRGAPVRERVDTEMKLPVSAVIPETYVRDENLRLHYYKALFSVETPEELAGLKQEMEDRFGPTPSALGRLFKVARLKRQLRDCGAKRIQQVNRHDFEVSFGTLPDAKIDAILAVIRDHADRYRLAPGNRLRLSLPTPTTSDPAGQEAMLDGLSVLVEPLAHALAES